jgi:hypothetical protein
MNAYLVFFACIVLGLIALVAGLGAGRRSHQGPGANGEDAA